jgi:hypothetical protein
MQNMPLFILVPVCIYLALYIINLLWVIGLGFKDVSEGGIAIPRLSSMREGIVPAFFFLVTYALVCLRLPMIEIWLYKLFPPKRLTLENTREVRAEDFRK